MGLNLPFIRRAAEIPNMRIGDRAVAYADSIDEVEGEKGPQVQFSLTLEGGYRSKAWLRYSEQPSELSNLGKLCKTLAQATGKVYQSVDEAMKDLQRNRRRIFVRCDGHKLYNGRNYPKLKIVVEELPEPPNTQATAPSSQQPIEPVSMSEEELREREQERLGKN